MADPFYKPPTAPPWFLTPHAHAAAIKAAEEAAKVKKAEEEAKKAEDEEWKELRKEWEEWRKGGGAGAGTGTDYGFGPRYGYGPGLGIGALHLDDYWFGGGNMYPFILHHPHGPLSTGAILSIPSAAPAPESLPPLGPSSWTNQRALWPSLSSTDHLAKPAEIQRAYAIPAEMVPPTWRVLRHLVEVRRAEGRVEAAFSRAMEWAIAGDT